jgi:ABC-type nitrate/sulfonate/bicarbonate transport system permease component
VHRRTAKALRLSPLATVVTVLAPAAIPEILSGIRIGARSHSPPHAANNCVGER